MRVIHPSKMTPYLKMQQEAVAKEKRRLAADPNAIPDVLLYDKIHAEYRKIKSEKLSRK